MKILILLKRLGEIEKDRLMDDRFKFDKNIINSIQTDKNDSWRILLKNKNSFILD